MGNWVKGLSISEIDMGIWFVQRMRVVMRKGTCDHVMVTGHEVTSQSWGHGHM
jgi:hypothetical protein